MLTQEDAPLILFHDVEGPDSLTASCKTCWCCSWPPIRIPKEAVHPPLPGDLDVQQCYHSMAHLENIEPGPDPAWTVSLAGVIYTLLGAGCASGWELYLMTCLLWVSVPRVGQLLCGVSGQWQWICSASLVCLLAQHRKGL